MIEMHSSSAKAMKRWVNALKVGARVTYPDYVLLERERQVLASMVLTPRAPTPRGPGGAPQSREHVPSVLDEEVDVSGNQLAPGAVQPYDANGNPMIRDPKGMLLNAMTGETVKPTDSRFSAAGEQLDPFNRPLPPNAAPMFTESGTPIGVGPDGRHYTPDGEAVEKSATHYDDKGKALSNDVVTAADEVAPTISVAVKVRAALKGETHAPELVDPLGRTFKSHGTNESVTQDGEIVPTTARRIEVGGQLVTYEEAKKMETVETVKDTENGTIAIKFENEGSEVDLGTVEVDGATFLSDVRTSIAPSVGVPDFMFLKDGVPITSVEEKTKLAIKFVPEITVRGRELVTAKPVGFSAKASFMSRETDHKKAEEEEFQAIMNRVRNKTFLHHVGRDLTN